MRVVWVRVVWVRVRKCVRGAQVYWCGVRECEGIEYKSQVKWRYSDLVSVHGVVGKTTNPSTAFLSSPFTHLSHELSIAMPPTLALPNYCLKYAA